jgi:outer membrane lipase/esterase
MQQGALLAVLFGFVALSTPGVADAAEFDQFIGLGDSTLDSGYFRYHTTGDGTFDTQIATRISEGAQGGFAGNGVMDSTILAGRFGLSGGPIGDGTGGTNYANGGSYTMNPGPLSGNVSVVQQIQNYLASVNGVANPNALYVVSSGNNDLNYSGVSPSYLSESAEALATQVAALQAAGARTIMVPNSFRYAALAGLGGDIDPSNAASYATLVQYGAERWSALTAAGVHYIPADLDSVFRFVVQNPTSFGFTASSVLAVNAPVYNDPSPYNTAILAILTPEQQQDYLFIDGKHLTTAGQTIEADYEYSLLVAPSQISLLAESVVQGGWARAATIQGQIEASARHRGARGINVWSSAGAYNMRVRNAPGFASDSGNPFGGSVGLDYLTSNGVIVGMALTAGSQRQEFSTGGYFDQVDEAPSLYVAYMGGPVWGNAVATYGLLQDNISRPVQLGIFTDLNSADTTGQSLALALRGGRDVRLGRLTTGPVAGLVMQEARVYGFTETGTSGVTALSFGRQTRESFVSQLGWRLLMDLGDFQPFTEMTWNHEFAGKDRTVTASLTSVAAPSYTMAAVPVVSDWATLSLGAYYQLSPQVVLRGGASSMFINPRMTTCGGEFGLNVSF